MKSVDRLNIEPACAQCGSKLKVERVGLDAGPDDPVSCPVHGVIGKRHDLDAQVLRQVGEQAVGHIGDALRRMGFKRE